MHGFFVTGTDTDVGKTLVSAWLLTHLDASYWKPVQAGTEPETDAATVKRLAEVPADRILPDIEFEATLAGAIHAVQIKGVLKL